ncbi:MAG: hypothetical protein M3Y87_12950 [Myxococcota bacterium]|nr:hypothetical protein [Myxococcota bacterium]
MALATVQRRLGELYDVELDVRVDDFLCDADTARALGGDDAAARGEVLFVVQQQDGARVALFVEPSAREPQRGDGWLDDAQRFRACCLAAEGVSHFVYLAFRADHEEEVSELELELQAEIDKWALGLLAPFHGIDDPRLLAGRGVGAIALRDRSRKLRDRLFGRARFLDAAGTERGDRYRAALRLGARYARELEDELVSRGDIGALTRELRRFYRLGSREKIERTGG